MMPLKLCIPLLNDKRQDFNKLAHLWQQVDAAGEKAHVHFDFSNCDFLRPNAVAFLGGLARLIEYRGGLPQFETGTIRQEIKTNLYQNGFANVMRIDSPSWDGNSIPYREDSHEDQNSIVHYLKSNWLGKGWINVAPTLANEIAGQMWEIYTNAFEHSQSAIGVFSCGQYFPKSHELLLAVADFGVGIPSNVRHHAGKPIHGKEAMRWAFAPGNTTARELPFPRGMGLDLLKEFIRINHGHLEIYSKDGYARVDSKGEVYENLTNFFDGTLVQVRLVCDDTLYLLSNEQESSPFF